MACLQDYYHETFEYPMEAINLTKANWDYIRAPVLKVCLPKSGIVCTFSCTVLYVSPTHNGLGIMHPYHQQHIKQLHLCLEQNASRNITHNLLDSNVEQLRLELGIDSSNGLWHTDKTLCYLTPCWLRDLLHFCNNHNITLQDNCPTIPTRTTQD